jgi:hypothetical protein
VAGTGRSGGWEAQDLEHENLPAAVRPFAALGFHPEGTSGQETFGDCLFCGKQKKLYINNQNGQWDCKVCGSQGNRYTYLKAYVDQARKLYSDRAPFEQLAALKGLSPQAVRAAGFVWDGYQWLAPQINLQGATVNIRRFRPGPGAKFMGLPECGIQLWGLEQLADLERSHESVFICEGEWDAISLREKHGNMGLSPIVLSLPGAKQFQESWGPHFKGRFVTLCLDAGKVGREGTARAINYLNPHALEIKYIKWPEGSPDGYDVRDFLSENKKLPIEKLGKLVRDARADFKFETPATVIEPTAQEITWFGSDNHPTFAEIQEIYWSHLQKTPQLEYALYTVYAAVLAKQLIAEMLWLFLVGPPGGAKTVILRSLGAIPSCIYRSSISANGLVSGFKMVDGRDPSLIPQLDQKTFVLKDFTEVLSKPKQEMDEIMSILRGAYDREVVRNYGNGIYRNYKVEFNMLAGVTPEIFRFNQSDMGERFIYCHIGHVSDDDSLKMTVRALDNSDKWQAAFDDLKAAAAIYLGAKIPTHLMPSFPENKVEWLAHLSHITAMLRARVPMDARRERLEYRQQHEIPTRLSQELKTMCMGYAVLEGRFTPKVFQYTQQLAIDSCTHFKYDIAAAILKSGEGVELKRLAEATDIPYFTLREHVEELSRYNLVNVVTEGEGRLRQTTVAPSERIKRWWYGANLPNGRQAISEEEVKQAKPMTFKRLVI